MDDFILLDNLPDISNLLLNILWEENSGLLLAELITHMNQRDPKNWGKKEIKPFLDLLIQKDYVSATRHGLKVYYNALSEE